MRLLMGSFFSSMRCRSETFMTSPTSSKNPSWQIRLAQVRAEFFERGESVAEWSRRHGFRANAVYQVLSGHTAASRGNAHQIAVALGLKGPSSVQSKPSAASFKAEEPM
jgi:gp16 family phage-associated protein